MNTRVCLVGFKTEGSFAINIAKYSSIVDNFSSLKDMYHMYSSSTTMAQRMIIHHNMLIDTDDIIQSCATLKEFYLDHLKKRGITIIVLSDNLDITDTINNLFSDTREILCRHFVQLTPLAIREMANEHIDVLCEKYKIIKEYTPEEVENNDEIDIKEVLELSRETSIKEAIPNDDIADDSQEENNQDNGATTWLDIPDEFDLEPDNIDEDYTEVTDGNDAIYKTDFTDIPDEIDLDEIEENPVEELLPTTFDVEEINEEDIEPKEDNYEPVSQDIGLEDDIDNVVNEDLADNTKQQYETVRTTNEENEDDINEPLFNLTENEDITDPIQSINDVEEKAEEKSNIRIDIKTLKSKVKLKKGKKKEVIERHTKVIDNKNESNSEINIEKTETLKLKQTDIDRMFSDVNNDIASVMAQSKVRKDRLGRKVLLFTGHHGAGVSFVTQLIATGFNMFKNYKVLIVDLDFVYTTTALEFGISGEYVIQGNVVEQIANSEDNTAIDTCTIELPSGLHVLTYNANSIPDKYIIFKFIYSALKQPDYDIIIFDSPVYVLDKLPPAFLYTVTPIFVVEATQSGVVKALHNIENMEFEEAGGLIANMCFLENRSTGNFKVNQFISNVESRIRYDNIPVIGTIPVLNWDRTLGSFVKLRKGKMLNGLENFISQF